MSRRCSYWVSINQSQGASYSIRARTRRECVRLAVLEGEGPGKWDNFEAPVKVTIEYQDAFDLVAQILGEGGSHGR
jgi:hypothetical protein